MVHEHVCFEDDFCAEVTKTFTSERPGTFFGQEICYDLLLGDESSYCMHYTYPDEDYRIVIDGLNVGSCDVVPDCDKSFDCLSRLVQSHGIILFEDSEDNIDTASNQEFTAPRLRASAAAT
jgi:hypothetical protein